MAVLECPLCCAERFTDIFSLQSHLLDLCENIICPVCELQFRTIKTLAWHLGQECNNLSKELPGPVNGKELNPSQSQETSFNISESSNKNINEELVIREEVPANNEIIEKNNEFLTAKDSSFSADSDNIIEIESKSVYEECVEDNIEYSASLYSCSVCDITFSSIEEHLNEFHKDENVIVDNNINEYMSENNNENSLDSNGKEAFPKNSSTWAQEEVTNLMIVNWNSKVGSLLKIEHTVSENPSLQSVPNSDDRCWVSNDKGYLIIKSEGTEGPFDKTSTSLKDDNNTSDAVNINTGSRLDEQWPESLKKYPLATFVQCNEIVTNKNISYLCENKSYIFNEHRVRLLKFCQKNVPPKIEDIPFPEEPPDFIKPILRLAHDVPEDLAGSYAVLWPCHLCGTFVYHWSDLAKHCCSSSPKYYPCTLCRKSFQTRRSLNNHYSVIHKIIHSSIGCYLCPLCPAKVQTSSHLEKHLAMHRKNDLVKCDFCESMIQKSTYSDHLKAHGTNGPLNLVCQLCNRPFKGKTELELHIPQCHLRYNEEDNLKCKKCNLNYEDLQTLREHLVSHGVSMKPHLCSFCPKSYNRLIDKVIHERVHTKSKPHSCNECGRCFRLRNSLVAHIRIHTGERPFKCSFCSRSFRTKHLQRSHLSTHSGIHQYKCSYCNKQFQSKGKVEAHENSHKKPFVCLECKRMFYSLRFAKKHMDNHKNGQLNYTCNMCPNMFTRAAYLEAHLRAKHGLDTQTSISISTQKIYQQMEGNINKYSF
ncbi:zinc finger protein 665 [Halyomorpha halys]|uniref:zinc finger protein 665 n=1 Tax=Halyomorpha halys TaxID=286706 RepID=UPI0006D4DDC0|nr:zinc finger protein 37-like [Halyomorpha halys]